MSLEFGLIEKILGSKEKKGIIYTEYVGVTCINDGLCKLNVMQGLIISFLQKGKQ